MPRFVVHEHKAKRAGLHYDLRIEVGDHLESYACRKGLPLVPGVKRLLIRQVDHEKWWLNFEGEIKEGYGQGTLKIWDKGTYKELSNKKNVRVLEFHGKKLKGLYVLVKLGSSSDSYIIFKKKS